MGRQPVDQWSRQHGPPTKTIPSTFRISSTLSIRTQAPIPSLRAPIPSRLFGTLRLRKTRPCLSVGPRARTSRAQGWFCWTRSEETSRRGAMLSRNRCRGRCRQGGPRCRGGRSGGPEEEEKMPPPRPPRPKRRPSPLQAAPCSRTSIRIRSGWDWLRPPSNRILFQKRTTLPVERLQR